MSFWGKSQANIQPRKEPRLELFEEIILPHLDAAHNFARWLTRDEQDARDVVQEACLRAFRFFDGFRGGDGKAWLLEIVRNTSRTWRARRAHDTNAVPFDETRHGPSSTPDQEQRYSDNERRTVLAGCIEELPLEFREVIVLRELEEMSYREIAEATGVAIGTVMSRLSRARRRLEDCAARHTTETTR